MNYDDPRNCFAERELKSSVEVFLFISTIDEEFVISSAHKLLPRKYLLFMAT